MNGSRLNPLNSPAALRGISATPPRFGAKILHNVLTQPLSREKGIAIYGGNSVSPEILAESSRWAAVFSRQGFHIVTGGSNGVMEFARQGAKAAGGLALGSGIQSWCQDSKPASYDRYTMNETVTQRFESPGGFYASAAYSLMFPGKFGTKSEAYRLVYDMMAGKTQYPIQKRLVQADLDPDFSHWVRSQFNPESYGADHYVAFAKTPEEALALFRDESIPRTDGIESP